MVLRKTRILVAAPSKQRAEMIERCMGVAERPVDCVAGSDAPRSFEPYRLLVCELGAQLPDPAHLLSSLRADAHVVLILPTLGLAEIARYMGDSRVSHFVAREAMVTELPSLIDKLETGAIFGLDRYLTGDQQVHYRLIDSYKKRTDALDAMEVLARRKRLRSRQRRDLVQVAEELLMNAMYQAPVDAEGARIFAGVSPRRRVRRRTPKPVSLRFGVHEKAFFISVRDRFGSFHRDDLAQYLQRCTQGGEVQLEQKELGAGLGLYLISSASTRLVVNVLPGSVAEFIAVLCPRKDDALPLACLSVTTQRPRA